jgi:AcrR family transcriptional regulator
MCYATKRKIADCVKQLMRKKEIRKITIQDIMDGTHMSRQSFYYHFRDIYDVIEWIGRMDFTNQIACQEGQTMEEWVLQLFQVMDQERPFLERIVREMEWPRVVPIICQPIEEQMRTLLTNGSGTSEVANFDFSVHFLTISYCYYLMDYIYHKKHKSNQELSEEVQGLVAMLDTMPMLQKMEHRMVG